MVVHKIVDLAVAVRAPSLSLTALVAQLDRALVCGTKGCRFDSDQVRVIIKKRIFKAQPLCTRGSTGLEHRSSEPRVGGSNPSGCVCYYV